MQLNGIYTATPGNCTVTIVTPATVFSNQDKHLCIKPHEIVALDTVHKNRETITHTYATLDEARADLSGPVWDRLFALAYEWQNR